MEYTEKDLELEHFFSNERRAFYGLAPLTRVRVCPECDGTNLNENKDRCWDCQPER